MKELRDREEETLTLPSLGILPDDVQLWLFGFEQPLSADDKAQIKETLETFLQQWKSHGAPVTGGYEILHDRFVAVAGLSADGLSGCSIDSCVANFKELKSRFGLDGLNRGLVFYRDSRGDVQSVSRLTFQQKLDSGEITPQTTVFDTTLATLGQLRCGAFETIVKKSWHARAFGVRVA